MPFMDESQLRKMVMSEGVTAEINCGEKMMMSIVTFDPNIELDDHAHPHEQYGLVLEGCLEFRLGDETKLLKPGDSYLAPSNVPHGCRSLEQGAKAVDIFCPPREDFLKRLKAEGK